MEGQAETLLTHMLSWPLTLTAQGCENIPSAFKEEVFTGQMPFLSPNQQQQSTEGKQQKY